MKLIITVFLTAVSFCIYSQDLPKANNTFEIVELLKINGDIKADSTQVITKTDSSNTLDIKASNWNTNVYNPFKNIKVKFPLQLKFEDFNYASPITRNKVVTSRYGWRRGRAHKGIDIDLITGDSVFAMFDGIVRFAKYNTGHGRTVIVRHYNGLETVYAHLSKYGVKANDTVTYGQYLGKGGTSGNARGSHLHLVINYKGVAINPEYLFEFTKNNTIRSKDIWVTKQWTRPYAHSSKRQSRLNLLLTEKEAIASLQKQKKIYIVKRGDTLSRISVRNNVSIASLCKTNAIKRTSLIKIGQKLVIEH